MEDHNNKKKPRGIESIAHLFLSQLDKQREDSSGLRTPPADNTSENEVSSGQDEITGFTAGYDNDTVDDTGRSDFDFDLASSLQGEIVLAYHLRDSYSKVHDYAEYQSQRDERVALVSIDQYEVTLLAVFNSEPLDHPVVIAETEGTTASLIPVINEAAGSFDTIILNVDPSFAPRINEIISHADCVTVITDCTNDGIVSSYQTLKSVVGDIEADQEISLFVCDAVNAQYADRAYYKFSETAKKYIDRTIIPAGCSLLNESEEQALNGKLHDSDNANELFENNVELQDDSGIETEIYQPDQIDNDISDEPDIQSINEMDNKLEEDSEPQNMSPEIYSSEELIVHPENFADYEAIDSVQTDDNLTGDRHETAEEKSELPIAETLVDSTDNDICLNGYKPAVSGEPALDYESNPDIKIFKAGQISSLEDLVGVSCDSRKAVISRPPQIHQSGPAKVAPVAVKKPLENDLEIAHFVGANLARLSDLKGMVSIELQQFEDVFPCARVLVDINGRVYVVLSAVYADSVAASVEMVVQWLTDNIGAVATRYRILKIKAYLPIQVVLIAGTNFNPIYDEALVAADELDAECTVYQLSSFELNNKYYISLQCG